MNYWRVLSGAAIGISVVAIAPFTGGGSVLGATTLAGSLSGARTIAAALSAGAAGAYIGTDMDKTRSLLLRARAITAAHTGNTHIRLVRNEQ